MEEFLLGVSGKSLGGIRMVSVAVPRMVPEALSLSVALMREAGGGEAV